MQIEWPFSDNYEYCFTILPLKPLLSAIHSVNSKQTIVVNNYSLQQNKMKNLIWSYATFKPWAWFLIWLLYGNSVTNVTNLHSTTIVSVLEEKWFM